MLTIPKCSNYLGKRDSDSDSRSRSASYGVSEYSDEELEPYQNQRKRARSQLGDKGRKKD
jgi:hypothetical protein